MFFRYCAIHSDILGFTLLFSSKGLMMHMLFDNNRLEHLGKSSPSPKIIQEKKLNDAEILFREPLIYKIDSEKGI